MNFDLGIHISSKNNYRKTESHMSVLSNRNIYEIPYWLMLLKLKGGISTFKNNHIIRFFRTYQELLQNLNIHCTTYGNTILLSKLVNVFLSNRKNWRVFHFWRHLRHMERFITEMDHCSHYQIRIINIYIFSSWGMKTANLIDDVELFLVQDDILLFYILRDCYMQTIIYLKFLKKLKNKC